MLIDRMAIAQRSATQLQYHEEVIFDLDDEKLSMKIRSILVRKVIWLGAVLTL